MQQGTQSVVVTRGNSLVDVLGELHDIGARHQDFAPFEKAILWVRARTGRGRQGCHFVVFLLETYLIFPLAGTQL